MCSIRYPLHAKVERALIRRANESCEARSLTGDAVEFLRDIRGRMGFARDHCHRCERVIALFIEHSGATTPDDLRPIAVMRWLQHRADEGIGRKTQVNDLCALRSFADWLVQVERLSFNALRSVKTPRVHHTRGCEPFTLEEVRAIIAAAMRAERCADRRSTRHGPIRSTFYMFLARTGLRHEEARRQRWRDIDLAARVMTVTVPKNGCQQVIPLDTEAVALLRWWRPRSPGDLVFATSPSHHTLREDCRSAGIAIKPGQWHRFRKMAVTERAKRGATMRAMQSFARHMDPKTTQKSYDFVAIAEMRDAAERLPSLANWFSTK